MNRIALSLSLCALLAWSAVARAEAAAVGSAAPQFTLKDHSGKDVSLADYKGKTVVLEWWNEGCPFIQRHAKAGTINGLADKYADKGVVVLAINSTASATNDSNKKAAETYGLKYPILNDSSGAVGKAYGAKTTPHMFIIDKDGKLAYSGAIDNDPAGNKSDRVNYVAKAMDELLAGQAVSTAETKSYGCSVKYRR